MSQAKVSKIETGRVKISSTDLNNIVQALDLTQDERANLLELYDALNLPDGDLRKIQLLGIDWKQREFQELELAARVIRVFELVVIPGLLQTESYARSMFRSLTRGRHAEVEDLVTERMRRQEILWQRARYFDFVIFETALWSVYGEPEEQVAQLERLQVLLRRPNISIGIISSQATPPLELSNAFEIIGDEYVSAETLTQEITVSNPRSVIDYLRHFRDLSNAAAGGDAAHKMLDTVMSALSDVGHPLASD